MIEFTSSAVRMLKGAPLSCLILMVLERQPVSAQYLERNTGYSDKLVHSALLLLEEKGLITRNARYAWQITDGVRQLPLMQGLMEPAEDEGSRGGTENAEEKGEIIEAVDKHVDKSVDNRTGSRRNSESEILRVPTSSRSLTTRLTSKDPPPELEVRESEKFRVSENLRACREAGIEEPKRSELARLEHVTARMIQYHAAKAPNIRLAIYRIGKGWKIPESWENGEGDEDRRKYITGEYADIIEH